MSGTGTFESDWGFSSDHEDTLNGDTSPELRPHDFAPPNRLARKRFNTSELRPLITANETISKSAKFYNLFTVLPPSFG